MDCLQNRQGKIKYIYFFATFTILKWCFIFHATLQLNCSLS